MDWMTELGPKPELANYGLIECTSWGYPVRTEENVLNSCVTVIFAAKKSRGSDLTMALCLKNHRNYLTIDPFKVGAMGELQEFCRGREVVNIAGNRERVFPGICVRVAGVVYRAFSD